MAKLESFPTKNYVNYINPMATRGNRPLFRWPKKGPLTSKIERPNFDVRHLDVHWTSSQRPISTAREPIWTFKERPCNVAVIAGNYC